MPSHWPLSAACTVVAVLLVVPVPVTNAAARAQAPAPAVQAPATPSPAAVDRSPANVSIDRIRRLLRETPPTPASKSSLLKLAYYVDVVGKAPAIDFFKDFHIGRSSTVQYGGMTHAEFLKITGPPWRRR